MSERIEDARREMMYLSHLLELGRRKLGRVEPKLEERWMLVAKHSYMRRVELLMVVPSKKYIQTTQRVRQHRYVHSQNQIEYGYIRPCTEYSGHARSPISTSTDESWLHAAEGKRRAHADAKEESRIHLADELKTWEWRSWCEESSINVYRWTIRLD